MDPDPDPGAQKHVDPDSDPQHWFFCHNNAKVELGTRSGRFCS
jgi:hypothetical protein